MCVYIYIYICYLLKVIDEGGAEGGRDAESVEPVGRDGALGQRVEESDVRQAGELVLVEGACKGRRIGLTLSSG